MDSTSKESKEGNSVNDSSNAPNPTQSSSFSSMDNNTLSVDMNANLSNQQRQLLRMKDEFQNKIKETELRVRRECEERLRNRRGEFYQSIEKEVAARMAKEQALKDYDLEAHKRTLTSKLETDTYKSRSRVA